MGKRLTRDVEIRCPGTKKSRPRHLETSSTSSTGKLRRILGIGNILQYATTARHLASLQQDTASCALFVDLEKRSTVSGLQNKAPDVFSPVRTLTWPQCCAGDPSWISQDDLSLSLLVLTSSTEYQRYFKADRITRRGCLAGGCLKLTPSI